MLKMEAKDLGLMWEKFSKYDKDKSGTIDIDEFYKLIGEKRSLFADSIFELIDLDQNNSLDFGEFIQTCGTFCMFGREDVRKFCYYIFDKGKLLYNIIMSYDYVESVNRCTSLQQFYNIF